MIHGDAQEAPVRIGRAGTWFAVLAAVSLLVAAALTLVWLGWSIAVAYPIVMWLITVVAVLFVMVRRRAHVLLVREDGLHVRSSKGSVTFRWAELLEVGLARALWPYHGPGLVVRPKGAPWDVPGPYAPAQVATLAVFSRRAQHRARERLRAACERHGVAFAKEGRRMGDDPPRRGGQGSYGQSE